MHTTTRQVEVFTAGCPVCEEAVSLIEEMACTSCDVKVLDMQKSEVAQRALDLGVRSLPAVAINGRLADCCSECGISEETLRAAGLGQPL